MDSDWYGAETFEASGCVGCQMQKPVSKDERAAIQKQVEKFNEQLALDPDDDFERYILLDLDDETLIEDAFFKRQGAWRPLTEAFRKRWGKRSELMDKISLAQFGEKSNYAIYSFEKPFWFEYECDPQDTATAEDPEGYGLGFEFDMTKEEAIEKARQIHKETKGAITMYNNARKRSGGGSTRIHPKFWATPEMMEEQKNYYEREDMKWPTGDALTDWSWEDKDEVFNVEFNEWADQELMSHGKDISFKDWAQDEGMKHGNTEITEWAQHEDESHDARYGAETYEDSWEKGVIRLAISSGCFSDEYAEWVERQIDGPNATLNNPRYKKIIDKRWGLSAETFNADVKMDDRAWVAYYEYDFMNVRPENPENITGDSKMVSFRDYRKELYGVYLTTQEAKKAFNLLKGSLLGHGDWKDGQYQQVINGYKQIYGGKKTIPMQMKFQYVPIRRFGYNTAMHTKTKNAETKQFAFERLTQGYYDDDERFLVFQSNINLDDYYSKADFNENSPHFHSIHYRIDDALEEFNRLSQENHDKYHQLRRKSDGGFIMKGDIAPYLREDNYYAETSGQWEIGEQLEEAQMNAEWERSWLVKSYPHTITKEQHDEIIKLLDEHDPNANIFYVRYGDTMRIITPHGPLNPSFLPTFSAESSQFPSMHYGDHDSDAQEKYQEFLDEWDGDDDPPSFEEWEKQLDEYDRKLQEYEGMNAEGQNTDLLKWIEDYLWDNDKKGYQAYHAHRKSLGLSAEERKKRSSLLSEPHEGTSLDSGEWKGILTGFGIGLLGLFGYSKLGK